MKLNESTRYFFHKLCKSNILCFYFTFFVQIISVLGVAIYSVIINKADNLVKQAINEVQEETGYDESNRNNEEG